MREYIDYLITFDWRGETWDWRGAAHSQSKTESCVTYFDPS